jgi:hypothetical protein
VLIRKKAYINPGSNHRFQKICYYVSEKTPKLSESIIITEERPLYCTKNIHILVKIHC